MSTLNTAVTHDPAPTYKASLIVGPADHTTTLNPGIIESIVLRGDLSGLKPEEKVSYYKYRCEQAGLSPEAKPFDLLKLNGKEVLYANASCTQQLCAIHKLSTQITAREIMQGIYTVCAKVAGPDGRYSENMGAVPIENLKGEALGNAMLKATTKAVRRTVLAHCGLGMLDETEVATIPDAQPLKWPPELEKSGLAKNGNLVTLAEAKEDDNGEGNAAKAIEETLEAIKDAESIDAALEEYDKSPEWMKGTQSFKEAVEQHMDFHCPEEWAEYKSKKKKESKKVVALVVEDADPMKSKYQKATDLETALGKAFSITQLSELYYNNIDLIEKNAAMKALFTARKLQITNGSLDPVTA